MTAELRRGLTLAGIGVVGGLAVVAAYFGTGDLVKRVRPSASDGAAQRAADLPESGGAPSPGADPARQAALDAGGDAALLDAAPGRPPQAGPAQGGTGKDAEGRAARDPSAPSLDIVRVEPGGDAVIAGRGAPNATVELLRDDKPVARIVADETGQFAIVPPPLPPGNSALALRATLPDGRRVEGRESVAVVISPDRKAQPLVAVSEPDKPTRVLSQPGGPAPGTAAVADGNATRPAGSGTQESSAKGQGSSARGTESSGGPVRIVSVDAQDGGRLFVSGQGAAGSALRLYLNDTLVASGRSGADGRVAFTIGRGVRPGTYQVRIDQVEGEGGKVRGRAQVAFAFPAQLAAAEPARDAPRKAGRPETVDKPAVAARASPAPTPATPPQAGAAGVRSEPQAAAAPPAAMPRAAQVPETPAPASSGSSESAQAPARTAEAPRQPGGQAGGQSGDVFVPEIDTARIIRGDSLWQISRRTYGDGKRYTVIYDANREQIRDPDLIYPGQIFVMPKDALKATPKDAPSADGPGARRG